MNLYYAMGGGLGHLTRARAFLSAQNLDKSSIILTASPFADDLRVVGNIPVVKADKNLENDPREFRDFVRSILREYKIESMFIDSFPFGIIGEFSDFEFPQNLQINYIARLLKWQNYAADKGNKFLRFNTTFVLENLHTEHINFIENRSDQIIDCNLLYSPSNLLSTTENTRRKILSEKSPFWLIVHSGNGYETSELLNYAAEMREIERTFVNLILISPQKLPMKISRLFQFDFYPATILFEAAERIFTACGFNAMRQTENFQNKHFFIPFERRFDDQLTRAGRRRKALDAR